MKWLADLAVMVVAAAIPCGVAEVALRIAARRPTGRSYSASTHFSVISTGTTS